MYGKPWPVAQWKFYIAFSLFRGASIYAGVHCRWIMGNASGGQRARHAGKKADAMIEITWAFIQRKSVLSEHPPSDGIKGKQIVRPIKRIIFSCKDFDSSQDEEHGGLLAATSFPS
ncbi:putative acyl-CoA dehydrogenase IBR3 [Forsythia ovata]|uniref:Acyl-CoA dehydrogenase IBR3 n=1 Tax=Forsythia ovata TaxID=205694 RepID=A0ABD1V0K5_9LAMI